jgi:hypothetical protein
MSKRRRGSNLAKSRTGFWGRGDAAPVTGPLQRTPDPAALPRSLGDPPLGANRPAAQHHLAMVYEEAVRAATALAAANGLLADQPDPGSGSDSDRDRE